MEKEQLELRLNTTEQNPVINSNYNIRTIKDLEDPSNLEFSKSFYYGHSVKDTQKMFSIGETSLYRWLKKYNIPRKDTVSDAIITEAQLVRILQKNNIHKPTIIHVDCDSEKDNVMEYSSTLLNFCGCSEPIHQIIHNKEIVTTNPTIQNDCDISIYKAGLFRYEYNTRY